jgi:hypothetical protein
MFFAFLALFPSLVESERFCLSCGNQVCSNVMCEMLCVYLYDFLLRVQSQYDCIFEGYVLFPSLPLVHGNELKNACLS